MTSGTGLHGLRSHPTRLLRLLVDHVLPGSDCTIEEVQAGLECSYQAAWSLTRQLRRARESRDASYCSASIVHADPVPVLQAARINSLALPARARIVIAVLGDAVRTAEVPRGPAMVAPVAAITHATLPAILGSVGFALTGEDLQPAWCPVEHDAWREVEGLAVAQRDAGTGVAGPTASEVAAEGVWTAFRPSLERFASLTSADRAETPTQCLHRVSRAFNSRFWTEALLRDLLGAWLALPAAATARTHACRDARRRR